jgi:fructokinase
VAAVTAHSRLQVTPPKVQAVDTTAAGDAFIGGLLAALVSAQLTRQTLSAWIGSASLLTQALEFACRCGAFTVTREGAYAALPKLEDLSDSFSFAEKAAVL